MDEVEMYALWHARHLSVEDDGHVIHQDSDGDIDVGETEWRLLGIYSREEAAESQLAKARELPGFCGEPDCFEISVLGLDYDLWVDGYFTDRPEGVVSE